MTQCDSSLKEDFEKVILRRVRREAPVPAVSLGRRSPRKTHHDQFVSGEAPTHRDDQESLIDFREHRE